MDWSDPRWVGAWWLPYTVTAALCLFVAVPLIGYPHDLPGIEEQHLWSSLLVVNTRSSAIADGTRDASCQLKYCQLPRNSAETTYTTSPDQIDGLKLEIQSEAMRDRQCALNHDAIESAPIVWPVINKPTTLSCVYHLSTDVVLWRNFLSPQCRYCSRDPDHAHLGSTHSSQD